MIAIFFSMLAACSAIGAEYLYRTLKGPWWHYLWLWTPMQLLTGYCIYRLVTVPGQPLLGALILWSFATIFIRMCVSLFILQDRMSPGLWLAVGLMVVARIAQGVWK